MTFVFVVVNGRIDWCNFVSPSYLWKCMCFYNQRKRSTYEQLYVAMVALLTAGPQCEPSRPSTSEFEVFRYIVKLFIGKLIAVITKK
jgi:hypothetical protein